MRKHVLIVSGIYPPDIGGPARFAFDFARYLVSSNFEVTIITYSESTKFSREMNENLTLIKIPRNAPIVYRILKMIKEVWKNTNQNASVLVIGAFLEVFIASYLRQFRYVVKVPGDIVWERARNSGYTKVNINQFQNLKLNFRYQIMRNLYTASLARAHKIITPSYFLKSLCLIWKIPNSKIQVIFNSIRLDKVHPFNNNNVKFDVITVCRLVTWKGVEEIINTCSKLNLSLLVVGDGPEFLNLVKIAGEKRIVCKFIGNVSLEEVDSHYQSARYFILNSTYEGLPHALLEAKAHGLICIARGGNGSDEVLTDLWDGFLVDDTKNENLESVLGKLISGKYDLESIQKNAILDVKSRFNQGTQFLHIRNLLDIC